MKHTIPTAQGRFTITPAPHGVSIKFKPIIFPEVGMILNPLEAAALSDAVEQCASASEAAAAS